MPSSLSRSLTLALLTFAAASSFHARALAHGVMVDGVSTDWSSRAPNGANLGIVARDAASTGEMVWLDASGDARTDLSDPELSDFRRFAVTADATNVYFLIEVGAASSMLVNPPQIQIAIDVDRVPGSGEANFAGFADTTVAADAEWELLVQTLGFSSARVRDTSFAVVGPAAFATTGGVVEMAVPWSLIEGPGRTLDVLRFTVAVFREDAASLGGDTVDLSGTSDALDVMTDYADPVSGTVFPNTFAEVMDGDVDYSIDVWFERRGREVYAPLSVSRFMSDAPTGATEWIELRNQTPVSLDLSSFCVGDEETPSAPLSTTGESMQCFPADALASGGVVTVALSAVVFAASYGSAPSYEESGTDATVDLTAHPSWVGGSDFALANGGDEVLVLGWHNTIVDLANYGAAASAYPGVTPRAAPASNRIATRAPVTQDTDDTAVDFPETLEDCGPAAGACTACRTCQRFACVADVGASCDDGDACTTGSTCTAAAACTGGSATVCPEDTNPCTSAVCSPATGCGFVNNTASCDDGDGCTTGDVCGAGTCSGAPRTCADTNPCTADACVAGACVFTPTPAAPCTDGNACTTLDACRADGTCGGTPVVCPDDSNPCTTAVCDATSGCGFVNNTATCDDGDGCTIGDVCAAGSCSGTPRTCADTNPCTADACVAGACTFMPTTGAACNDGSICTSGDACTGAGTCVGAPITCAEDSNPCTTASCSPVTGCVFTDNTAVCDDGDACTMGDRCSAGVCSGSGMCDAGVDAGVDAGEPEDAGSDAGGEDAGGEDAGGDDAGEADASVMEDAGELIDVGPIDVGPIDAGDAGSDGGATDSGPRDGGPFDGGAGDIDAGPGGVTGGSCNCRVGSASAPGWGWLGLALGLVLAVRSRR